MVKQFFSITLLAIIVSSCTAMTPYDFSFSAEEDRRFWLSRAVFNGYIGAGAGNVGCCLATWGGDSLCIPRRIPLQRLFCLAR